MPNHSSRCNFQLNNPKAKAYAALDDATNKQLTMTPGGVSIQKDQFAGKTVVVLGSGVGGLTTAYEFLKNESGAKVIVLEANNRTGGRCLTLRTGDTLVEDEDRELVGSKPGKPQVVRFQRPLGDSEPYLNAGPGRIPSSHKRLLNYLKQFGVDVEVYVMNSESNLVQKDTAFGGKPMVYRQLDHNTRGWLAEMVFNNAEQLIESVMQDKYCAIDAADVKTRSTQLKELMVDFGELTLVKADPTCDCTVDSCSAKYIVTAGDDGLENGKSRAGYAVLPGVDAGETEEPISFNELLNSEFWSDTRFYQPVDFLWQPTLFQPVGGMDRVQHSFAQQVAALGGTTHLNSPVTEIDWDETAQQFKIKIAKIGSSDTETIMADYCFSNLAMPFLEHLLTDTLLNTQSNCGFNNDFTAGLDAVFKAQKGVEDDGYIAKFLACTTKVGWQAERYLWQGSKVQTTQDSGWNDPDSEIGVVPIFGGISWTNDDIQQIWYPSTAYHDQKGVLTGAYNFSKTAHDWGTKPVQERLDLARAGATKFGVKFGEGLDEGLAIAWQNMPHIKGGWGQWHVVEDAVTHFNKLSQGTCVYNSDGSQTDKNFFVVGDQISSLPGWQEGAIASAINAANLAANPGMSVAHLKDLPDTRLMVEGV